MSKLRDQAVTEARNVLPPEEQDRFATMIQDARPCPPSGEPQPTRAPKGKWARVAERISREAPLNEEAAGELRRISRAFRDDFAFRHDLTDE